MSNQRYDAITGRDYEKNGEKKTNWTRIGVAFANEKGGFDVTLDALPVNGRVKLVIPKPKEGDTGGAPF